MKMNFLGLHTYPYASKNGGHATGSDEPTVFEFVGTVDDLQPDGDGDGAEVVGAGPDLVGLLGRLGRRALRRTSAHFGRAHLRECRLNFHLMPLVVAWK